MIDLIDIDEAKAQLRVTHSYEDFDIQLKTSAASAIVLNYLKVDLDESPIVLPWSPSPWEEVDVPFDIKAATLLVVEGLYMRVDDPLTAGVKSLLHRYRDPALA